MSLPIPEYGKDDKETIQNLMDTVIKLRKELEYLLYHLDGDNIPSLEGMKGDIDGAHSAIIQTEEQITLLVESVDNVSSTIDVMANEINLKVGNDQYSASVIIEMINNASQVTIDADKIDLNGITTMDGLAQVFGILRIGNPYANISKIILAGENFITSGANTISLLPSDVGQASRINLSADLIYASTSKMFVDELVVYSNLNLTGATVTGDFTVVAKFA